MGLVMKTNLVKQFKDYKFHRILIIGCLGSGKSTLGAELSKILDIEVIHLDKLFWKKGWVESSKDEFDEKLDKALKKPSWIIDGNYSRTMKKRIESSDLIIYLDYDTKTCLDSYYKRVEEKSISVNGFITDGCVEQIDPVFVEYIKEFNSKNREMNYQVIDESNREWIIFSSRQEKEEFIKSL